MNLYTELDELIVVRDKVRKNQNLNLKELEALHSALINKKTKNMLNPDYKARPWLEGLSSDSESLALIVLNNVGTDAPDIARGLKAAFFKYALPAEENERFFGNTDNVRC